MKSKAVVKVTKALNKKGKLTASNKKEKRMLKGICPHHRINKHGKVKPTIFSNDGEYVICSMCGATFPADFFSDKEIKDAVNGLKELNNQNKFTSHAINAGEQMTDFFSEVGVQLENYQKNAEKVRDVAKKQNNVKSKKKKNNNHNGSSSYGSWSPSR